MRQVRVVRCRTIKLGADEGCIPALVGAEAVELPLEFADARRRLLLGEPSLERLVEPLNLAAGLGVVGARVHERIPSAAVSSSIAHRPLTQGAFPARLKDPLAQRGVDLGWLGPRPARRDASLVLSLEPRDRGSLSGRLTGRSSESPGCGGCARSRDARKNSGEASPEVFPT